jgi:hypothetical protein
MVSVESRIEQVTVYSTGARVRRIARLAAPFPSTIRFVGLPLGVMTDTVRIECDGGAMVTAVRADIDITQQPAAEESPEIRAARRKVALVETELERLSSALEQLAHAPLVADDPSDSAPAAWAAVVAARRALAAVHVARELELRSRLAAARREAADARRELEIAVDRDRRAGTAKAARVHELRKQIELELVATAGATAEIHLEYQVAAARWAPSYVARLDGDAVRLEMRAVVAQASGEDWAGASLRLSTAEPERFAELPELAPQRIGRRQDAPGRRGFREPPAGGEELFADYDRGFPARGKRFTATSVFDDSTYEGRVPPPPAAAPAQPVAGLAQEVWDEESSRARPIDRGMLPQEQYKGRLGMPRAKSAGLINAIAGAVSRREPTAPPAKPVAMKEAAPVPRLDYANLMMAMPATPQRGHLVPAPARAADAEVAARVAEATAAVAGLVLPPGCTDAWAHAYDYAFTTDGKVDVRSDGAWRALAVTAQATTAKLHHVCVPREQADVFRIAAIANPFAGPLLPGPIDVYDRGQFVVTSVVDATPSGATVDVGLGVDAAVKLARNVEFHEEATGVLRGALRLVHAITVELDNASGRAVDVEVRERVPVARDGDDDVEVVLGKIDPAWERWTPDPDAPADARLRGGYRWRVALPAGGKRTLRAGYEVKIAGKLELVGGNRREP